jgi:hypothetical protein
MKIFSSCHVVPPEPSSAKKKQPSPRASNSNSTIPTTNYPTMIRSSQRIPNRRPGDPKANGQAAKPQNHAPVIPAPVIPAPVIHAQVIHAQARVAPMEQV